MPNAGAQRLGLPRGRGEHRGGAGPRAARRRAPPRRPVFFFLSLSSSSWSIFSYQQMVILSVFVFPASVSIVIFAVRLAAHFGNQEGKLLSLDYIHVEIFLQD